MQLAPYHGALWRLIPEGADPLAPGPAPEGRFHHDGQEALYGSLSPEGCEAAMARYLRPSDGPKVLVRLEINAGRVLDLRDPKGLAAERGVDPACIWQDHRAESRRAPTWDRSDTARAALAEGMLYGSRSRPELTHLVLFGVNRPGKARASVSEATPWQPAQGLV